MSVYVYGKTLPVQWRPFAGEGIAPGDAVPIFELVNARLYKSAPTVEQIDDASASLGGFTGSAKTAFSATDPATKIYTVTFDAVTDPNPHSSTLYDTWYPVWNVRYEPGGPISALHRPIELWRPVPQLWQLEITPEVVYAVEPDIRKSLGDVKTLPMISAAQGDIFRRIKNMGLDRSKLQEVDLTEAATYLARSYCLRDMSTKNNNYEAKADYWEKKFEALWAGLKLGYDTDNDGDIEPEERVNKFRSIRMVI